MAAPANNNNIATPGATPGDGTTTTPGTTSAVTAAGPPAQNDNQQPQKNQDKYQLMNANDDYQQEGDMKQNNNNNNITPNLADQPFGGYHVPIKQQYNLQSDYIKEAINKMERDINIADFEKKENEQLLDEHFRKLIGVINDKKIELMAKLNQYYSITKVVSTNRINELKIQLNQALEKEKKVNVDVDIQNKLKDISKAKDNSSVFTRLATKLTKKNVLKDDDKNDDIKANEHDKLRVFFPVKELNKMIKTEIRVANEWWNALKLNHNEYCVDSSSLWRIQSGGWFNAFGSVKVRYTQKKRWNIRVLPRGNIDQSKPADLVVGVIESDKAITRDKKNAGFWEKGFDGFGFYGWNGRIFHLKKKGNAFGSPFYVNQTVGIELDMSYVQQIQQNNDKKNKKSAKPKPNTAKNIKKGIIFASGATLTFFVDDKDIGVAFYDIDTSKEYVLAVAINNVGYTLKLID